MRLTSISCVNGLLVYPRLRGPSTARSLSADFSRDALNLSDYRLGRHMKELLPAASEHPACRKARVQLSFKLSRVFDVQAVGDFKASNGPSF